jgi:hypothetical protein
MLHRSTPAPAARAASAMRHPATAQPPPSRCCSQNDQLIATAWGAPFPLPSFPPADFTMSLMSIQPLFYMMSGPEHLYGFVFGW